MILVSFPYHLSNKGLVKFDNSSFLKQNSLNNRALCENGRCNFGLTDNFDNFFKSKEVGENFY